VPKSDATPPPAPPKDYVGGRPRLDPRLRKVPADPPAASFFSSESTELIPAWEAKELACPLLTFDTRLFQRNIQAINGQIRKAAQDHKFEVVVRVSPGLEREIFDHLAAEYRVCDLLLLPRQSSGFIELDWSNARPPREPGPHGPLPPPPPQERYLSRCELFWLKRRTPKPPT